MASRIYEYTKLMNHEEKFLKLAFGISMLPIIAKGNKYQHIEAQW